MHVVVCMQMHHKCRHTHRCMHKHMHACTHVHAHPRSLFAFCTLQCSVSSQLDRVPYPYKSHEHMKAVFAKPIGRDFNTEVQFRKNIKPHTVVSRIGQIIEPIDESALLHGGQKRKSTDIALDSGSKPRQQSKRKRRGNV